MWLIYVTVIFLLFKVYSKLFNGKCYSDSVMCGKVAIVTGGNSGIGYETALELARRGAKVILACRDETRGHRAAKSIIKKTKNHAVRFLRLDLSSLKSVRNFVSEFNSTEAKLDVLVNNAGASGVHREVTEDGIIKDMQINHFGPFLLTLLLIPILIKSAPSRIVMVSSTLHRFGNIDNLNKHKTYIQTYCDSKLCNVLFSNELARRLEGTGVVVNSLYPGHVNTCLYKSTMLEKIRCLVLYSFFKNPAEGAQTSIYLAVSEDCDQVTGKYFVDCKESTPSKKAQDEKLAAKLWKMSENMVGLRPEEMM